MFISRLPLGIPAFCLAIYATFGMSGQAADLDAVNTVKDNLTGRVIEANSLKIDLERDPGGNLAAEGASPKKADEIPINQVVMVYFAGEPEDLKSGKDLVLKGRFGEASIALDRIKDDASRIEIKQDIEYYRALCAARLALAGAGKIADAGRMMKSFVDNNPKSYHYFEGAGVVGDLLVGIRQFPQAAEYYARLDKAPWPDFRMRAGIAVGNAFMAEGKYDDAMHEFDKVLAIDATGELADAQRVWAQVGRASALVAAQKPDEAIKIVEGILQKANPENEQLQAHLYNVLGAAHRQAGRNKEALLAFLHVDLLYPSVLDAHAEALGNLAELWDKVHRSERARQARRILEEQYKESPWAKKGGT